RRGGARGPARADPPPPRGRRPAAAPPPPPPHYTSRATARHDAAGDDPRRRRARGAAVGLALGGWPGRVHPARRALEPRMSFASPVYLIGLALIPVLVVLYVRGERRPHAFAPAHLLPPGVRRRAGWRRHAAIVGYGVAVAGLLVALAKPQTTIAVPTEQARVMIVTDRSGSMLATDVKPTRLAAAKKAAG